MDLAGIRLRGVCKIWHYDSTGVALNRGDLAVVSTERGISLGVVTDLLPSYELPEGVSRDYPKVLRPATAEDIDTDRENEARERAARDTCLRRITARGLPMKLIRAEFLLDRSKAIFYFTADGRIDFRELVKDLARELHTRIEMRQIGVRDEARVVGGMGPCGKELCCATFLSDFAPITVKMAKDQRLSLNPAKLSGVCGRLMCCLIYEHHSYARVTGQPEGALPCDACHSLHETAAEAGGEPLPGETAEAPPPAERAAPLPPPRTEARRPVRPRADPPAPRRAAPEDEPPEDDEEVLAAGDEEEDGPEPEDGAAAPDAVGAPKRRRRSRRRRGRGGKSGGDRGASPPGGAPPGSAG